MTNNVEIVTNNQPRPIMDWHALTEREREEFDYLDTEQKRQDATFFRYKGNVYDLGDAMAVDPMNTLCKDWQFYYGESYFSAVVGKYTSDCEEVIIGLAFT